MEAEKTETRFANKTAGWIVEKLHSITRGMSIIAAVIIGIMMVVNVADVGGRYIFNKPVYGAYEIIGMLMICASAWGLAYCEFGDRHVKIELIVDRFPPKAQAIFNSIAHFIALVTFSIITWQMFARVYEYITRGAGNLSEQLSIPSGLLFLVFAIGVAMFCLVILVHLIEWIVRSVKC